MTIWAEHRVLVTGATGMVGGWLIRRLLEQGADVVCLVRDLDPQSMYIRDGLIDATSVVSGAVEDLTTTHRALVDHEVTVVFHLAAQTIVGSGLRNPFECVVSNVIGTTAVLEACRQQADMIQAVVVASSDKAYGSSRTLPYVEDMPLYGEHPYDVSKSCADLISTAYFRTYGTPVTVARCGNIFGGGDLNWSRLVPGTMRALITGDQPLLRSDGTMKRDWLHVDDAVDAYLHLARQTLLGTAVGEAFNFSDQSPLTVMQMYKRICQATVGEYVEPKILAHAHHEIPDQYLDSSKASRMLNWAPVTGIDAGLADTADWYRTYWKRLWQSRTSSSAER